MKHFIRKSGSVFLDADLYKAVPSETFNAPPTKISGRTPTKSNVDEYIWKMAQKYGLQDIYPALIGTVRTESGRKHWRRKGKGKILTSETGAKGLMQLMPKTAEGVGVEREDWRQNIEGGVKLWANNYNQAINAGMPPQYATDYAAQAYFSGGAGSDTDSKLNTSAVEVHNQKALANYRKTHPNATVFDVPSEKLKGAPSQVSRYGGVKDWRKNQKSSAAGAGGINPETGKRNFTGALDKYARGVEKRSETGRHYIPVGSSRSEAEKFGLTGVASSSQSVPVTQSTARPEDLKPPTPKAVATKRPQPAGPLSTSGTRSAEASRRQGLEVASQGLGLPSPSKVLSNRGVATSRPSGSSNNSGLFNRLRSRVQGPRNRNLTANVSPPVVKSMKFDSELFVEE